MTEVEMLTSRLIDRPSRPLFPKGWRFDTQIIAMVVSTDRENATDVLAMTGASARAAPQRHPLGGPVRRRARRPHRRPVRRSTRPSPSARSPRSTSWSPASRDAIVMVEGERREIAEDVIIDALMFAHQAAQPLIDLQEKLRAAVGKPKREFVPPAKDPADRRRASPSWPTPKIQAGDGRSARSTSATRRSTLRRRRGRRRRCAGRGLPGSRRPRSARRSNRLKKKHLRELVLNTGRRIDGRARHRHPPDHLRGRGAAARARLGAVHPRRDPGAGDGDPRHQARTSSRSRR